MGERCEGVEDGAPVSSDLMEGGGVDGFVCSEAIVLKGTRLLLDPRRYISFHASLLAQGAVIGVEQVEELFAEDIAEEGAMGVGDGRDHDFVASFFLEGGRKAIALEVNV